MTTDELDQRCLDAVARWVAAAPPLTKEQQDLVSVTFRGAFKPRSGQ